MGLFGTDGIRDRAGSGHLAPDAVVRVGRALARFAAVGATAGARVALARDTRPSGPSIARDLARGLLAEDAAVDDLGLLPTPALAWTVATRGYDLGLAISASHNPEADNGIKPFARGGRKLTDAEEAAIETLVAGLSPATPEPRAPRVVGGQDPYVRETTALLLPDGSLAGMRLVVDVAAGAAGATAPRVLEALGARLEVLHPPGSRPINDACGTEHPEPWLEAVRAQPCDAGLAFDGDADRVLLADPEGGILDGDAMLAILAVDAKRRGALPGDLVVTTVMSNFALEERLRTLGIRLERVPVGDRHVAARMRALGAVLGAEPSGHVVLPRDGALLGDALVAGVRVLQAAARSGRPLATLRRETPRYPQVLTSVRVREKRPIEEVPTLARAIAEEEAALAGSGRLVVRYSGTEPVLRIMAEARNRSDVERAVARIESAAKEGLR
jgi:phosphoglucosamine mutase